MLIRPIVILFFICCTNIILAQTPAINSQKFDKKAGASLTYGDKILKIKWPAGNNDYGQVELDMENGKPLFSRILLGKVKSAKLVSSNLDPSFLLTIGKRDLVSQNGWNIFFDKVPKKPFKTYDVKLEKSSAVVETVGSHTVVKISSLKADSFNGDLEITFYNGSPLFNIAAVMATDIDSSAIVYDAGLVSQAPEWETVSWINTADSLQTTNMVPTDTSKNIAVKYRTIAAKGKQGTLALFPAPHQYFYPLDEAFNLKFTWYGNNYRKMVDGYGIGIRQDLQGDKRFVPWFNAPPGTKQRLNFFCLLSTEDENSTFSAIKKFTHNDAYVKLPGYKTMSSHFHNEFIMNVVLANKPIPEVPDFVKVFKRTGVDIVHLAEFHYTAHPKGPDEQRLKELHALFEQCKRLSDDRLLLLPGEEPNEFFGGHWLSLFPKPVYWIMSREKGLAFSENHPSYGKIYHIGDKKDMLKLLEQENGLAWTAHARTKGSVETPDLYKNEDFFLSDHFMGAAWKPMPADLSQPRLGKRVLDLMDDMNNWNLKKTVISEADLFTITPENEMYAHMNVNYLMLDSLPKFTDSWQPVLNSMQKGRFFTSTGEVLMPSLTINGKQSGETLQLDDSGLATVKLDLNWTFPMNFVEVISGDGNKVYREKIDLTKTEAFGSQSLQFKTKLSDRTWVRIEAWDIAANGAFSQSFYIAK
ncbi:CehA/McbA family metallohydrolase domain-containing protein [Olivibacter domesticus]|uniref:Uncharacterized protein n=1 Tax=Olivibacter domesticus TaxID=407022 RepID=A0A1H7MIY4_OLID1|nr:hypothetical protein [Olivibacter domesticus]SEL11213.1 hypothetical protein SAMN05661044_02028 [Olivibacter domesticus]